MDELAKAMKVIRLKDEEYGQFLTAGEDKVSITLTKPGSNGYNPKNTEWRLEWLNGPKNLVGQVRLWSIYNKVLTFAEDPADYYLNTIYDALTQESWPVAHGGAASEWRFELRSRNINVTLVGDLFKRSKKFSESLVLNAKSPSIDNKSRFIFNSFYRKTLFRWLNCNSWLIEVVVSPTQFVVDDNDDNKLTTSVKQKTSSLLEQEQPLVHREISSMTVKNDQDDNHEYCDKSLIDPKTKLNMSVNQKTFPLSEQPLIQRQISSMPVTNDQDDNHEYYCDKSSIDSKTKLNTSVKQKKSPLHEQPLKQRQGPIDAARSSNIGYLRDHFMNTLSKWQVGQVYLHVSPTPTGMQTSAGYNYARYCNSGSNVNGSGVQKNGDISVHSEINRSRDNNANFVNYEYELSN